MAGNVFALLAGINEYPPGVGSLRGCVDDVGEFEAWLRGRIAPDKLQLEAPLLDAAATRQAIVDGFTAHLGEAGPEDVAVFYFAGHGSVENVADRFWYLEPTGQNQTLVCADSRAGGLDLADKELSALIDQVASAGPHVVVILDCCHSGGGTRAPVVDDIRVRLAQPVTEPRSLDSYLSPVQTAVERAAGRGMRTSSHTRDTAASITSEGVGRHVALSACESHERSQELPIDGRARGVFSASLSRALATLPGHATYRDLLRLTAIGVRSRVGGQHPIAFATDPDDLSRPLFGGAIRARRSGITLERVRGVWSIDAGAVHGIQQPRDGETTVLAALPSAAGEPAAQPLGRVHVTSVEPANSQVEIEAGWDPSPNERYPVVIIDVPEPPTAVALLGDETAIELVRAALASAPHVREVEPGASTGGARFLVLAGTDELVITRADATPLTAPAPATPEGAAQLAQRLEHLARWHLTRDLHNPASRIAGQVTLELVPGARGEQPPPRPGERSQFVPDGNGDIRVSYRRSNGRWQNPYVFAYIHNFSDRDLYCTLLDLTDRYRCHSKLFPVERIAAGRTAVAFAGRPIDITIPPQWLESGGTRGRDWFKLVASEARFEADAYELPELDEVLNPNSARAAPSARQGQTRTAGDEIVPAAPEWTTAIVSIVADRPPEGVDIPAPGALAVLTNGREDVITLHGHSGLTGVVAALGTTKQAARSLQGRDVVPPLLVSDPAGASALLFSTLPDGEDALDHLVLSGDIGAGAVTAKDPLRLRLHQPLAEGDVVLAVARDRDLFLPLGFGAAVPGTGEIEVRVERLPEDTPADEVADGGLSLAVHIYFLRVLDSRLGVDPGWPRLSVASPAGRDHDPTRVCGAVMAARTLLLVVHGVLGDTRMMLPGITGTVGDRYDAVLAFDFDAIGKTIEENARALGERLRDAGVVGGEVVLDVVSHSVGALVARWWIERDDGASVVRRAVLTGVPNAGTPWAQIQGWPTSVLALGLNGLTAVSWSTATLGWAVAALELAVRGIDEFERGSDMLKQLAESADGVPYTVLVGNASVPSAALDHGGHQRLSRLLEGLGSVATALPLLSEPNDLVVTAASMQAFAEEFSPPPVFLDVACDHLTYFERPESLNAISTALVPLARTPDDFRDRPRTGRYSPGEDERG